MKRVGRSLFRKIYWLPLLGILVLMAMVSVFSTAVSGAAPERSVASFLTALSFAFWFWLICGRLIAYHLVPMFVSSLRGDTPSATLLRQHSLPGGLANFHKDA